MKSHNLILKKEEYPYKNTPVALCFEAEIKRLADERGEAIGALIANLARMSGVSERQIYNYRSGKTEIQPEQIKIFCQQFKSLALAAAWVATGIEPNLGDEFDLSRFASQMVRNFLQCGEKFLKAFDDGKIDGHEMNDLEFTGAQINRDTHRLLETARDNHNRLRAA